MTLTEAERHEINLYRIADAIPEHITGSFQLKQMLREAAEYVRKISDDTSSVG